MKKRILKNLLILFIATGILSVFGVNAQIPSTTVTGRVVSDNAKPVTDVIVFSSIDRAITDSQGNFTIEIPANRNDRLHIDEKGYKLTFVNSYVGTLAESTIVLEREQLIDGSRLLSMPYANLASDRVVSAINVITSEELARYPATSAIDALTGRIPGLVITKGQNAPSHESVSASIRGVGAVFYIDGIQREPNDLTLNEIEKIEIIKDFSGRAALGITGASPVIWVTTKSGQSMRRQINVTADMGMSSPTVLPNYLDAYNYATLYNEALANDGLSPRYSADALAALRDGTDPINHPNIDYYDRFVRASTPIRRVSMSASGGDDLLRYFSMLDYVGTDGLEAEGEMSTLDRYKIRGNVDIKLTDFLSLNVNLSATYGKTNYANTGGGAGFYNMFNILSTYPNNATPLEWNGLYIIADDYPVNLVNTLNNMGYASNIDLNTQNSTSLKVDLGGVLEGLTFVAGASFDVNNAITNNLGGTSALYRIVNVGGVDTVERMVEENIVTGLSSGYDYFLSRTTFRGAFNYERAFGNSELNMHASYLQMVEDTKVTGAGYQPYKAQDLAFRANYSFDRRYTLQLDLSYSGSMQLPEGERFNLFPTVGAAWVASNESFLQNNSTVNYLKLYASFGVMGLNAFNVGGGYNQYYLHQTYWGQQGTYTSGIDGQRGAGVGIRNITQQGSDNYTIPKRNYFNAGIQTTLFNNFLSAEVNYFYHKNYDLLSIRQNSTPSLFGTGGFLPVTNYGENMYQGVDGMVQVSQEVGDFRYSIGANAMFGKGKHLVVDEPAGLPEYRKRVNTATDLFWIYEANGLFQNQAEVDAHVDQTWGTVRPGDVKYVDQNNDGIIDERDVVATGAHAPRIHYGLNFSLGYKRFNLFVAGKGVYGGERMLSHGNYFWISSTTQKYSEPMLDRWPQTNDYPRLTTTSRNNYQSSTYWLADASYLSLHNVELSYTLPKTVAQSLLMTDFTVFARGRNLLYISDITSKYGLNPENINAGISSYPMLRSVTFGISCKF